MSHRVSRREFVAASTAAGIAAAGIKPLSASDKPTLHKALIGKPSEKTLREWKEAGFEGMESNQWNVSAKEATEARRLAERLGMKIHSVLRGWTNFNVAEKLAGDLESVETALKAAQGYGADALLLVPCRVGGSMAIPEPWEFDIEFDEATGHLKKVVAGDNRPYQQYIEAHNHATDTSREAVRKLIPVAEKTGVVIALENVWNNLWVKPEIFRHFVASFQSPWVQAYYDIGNHVKYAPSEQWIHALGKLIVKCHVKDFQLNPDGRGGKFVNIRDGSVNWPVVRQALADVGYRGWMTIEGSGGLSLDERSRRLDAIIRGE